MNVTKTISDGKELVKVEGRLDSVNASQLEASVKEGLDEISELEFDFSKLEYISSAGLRILLSTLKSLNAKGGSMYLSGCNDTILEILEVTGFKDILNIK